MNGSEIVRFVSTCPAVIIVTVLYHHAERLGAYRRVGSTAQCDRVVEPVTSQQPSFSEGRIHFMREEPWFSIEKWLDFLLKNGFDFYIETDMLAHSSMSRWAPHPSSLSAEKRTASKHLRNHTPLEINQAPECIHK